MKELNLDDTRLTDDKMRTLAPLIVRFKTVKIGGKQDYGQKGLEELRLYMEQVINQHILISLSGLAGAMGAKLQCDLCLWFFVAKTRFALEFSGVIS